MRLLKLTLEEYSCFDRLEAEFHPGLNAIVGPIGSGKSSILEAIRFAFTGQSHQEGVKTANIRAASSKSSRSGVELTFEHRGQYCSLSRGLRPCGQMLRIGDNRWSKDKEISEALADFLGATPRVLSDHVLVGQWDMFAMLESDAARVSLLQDLVGTTKMLRLDQVLADLERRLVLLPVSGELEQRRKEAAALRSRQDELQAELQALPELVPPQESPAAKLLVRYRLQEQQQGLLVELEQSRQRLGEALQAACEELVYVTDDCVLAEAAWQKAAPEITRLQKLLAEQEAKTRANQTRQHLQEQLERLDGLLAALSIPTCPGDYPVDATILEGRKLELARLTKLEEALRHGKGCPLCGTGSAQLSLALPDIYSQRQAVALQVRNEEAQHKHAQQYAYALQSYKLQRENYLCQKRQLQTRLDELAPWEPTQDVEELRRQLEELQPRQQRWQQTQQRQELVQQRQQTLQNEQQRWREQLERLQAQTPQPITKEQHAAAQEELLRYTTLWRRQQELAGALAAGEEQGQPVLARIKQLETIAQQQRGKEELALLFRKLRKLFHRDNLPKRLAKAHLLRLTQATNQHLERLAARYRIQFTDDLALWAQPASGGRYDARRLSGGEKVLLALSLRLVVYDYLAPELGFLALDEPTAGLDRDNLQCIETALDELRRSTRAQGMQVLLVTHEPLLASLFDRVHWLGRATAAPAELANR